MLQGVYSYKIEAEQVKELLQEIIISIWRPILEVLLEIHWFI